MSNDRSRMRSLMSGRNHEGRLLLEYADVRVPIEVIGGPWHGCRIRRAKKLQKCDGDCGQYFSRGMLYLEGADDNHQGNHQLCLKCAGPMPQHAVAKSVLKAEELTQK